MDLFSDLCRQWADQHRQLEQQLQLVTSTMAHLSAMIEAAGGNLATNSAEELATEAEAPAITPAEEAVANDYDTSGSWAWKISYVLGTEHGARNPLPVADIATAINWLEPDLPLPRIIKAVTMEASKMGLNGKLGIKKKGNKNFYFLPLQPPSEQGSIGFAG